MTTRRFDAPAPCGCELSWTDAPSGPKAAPCTCSAPGRKDESVLDAALATFDAEQRQAAKAGPPACAIGVRDAGPSTAEHEAGPPRGAAVAGR